MRNQVWVKDNCHHHDADTFTVFIIPGDIGSEIDSIERIFKTVTKRYDCVCFVPGNHELWKRGTAAGGSATRPELRGETRMASDSVAKLVEVLALAKNCGVHVGPVSISYGSNTKSERRIRVVPLYSWYHSSWDTEAEITNKLYLEVERVIPFSRKWGDYSLCSWPADLLDQESFVGNHAGNTVLADAFAQLNEPFLPSAESLGCSRDADDTTISFSHFLPRQELCPEKRFLIEPLLSKVIGSDALERQIRRLKPDVHLFGHTHIPIDLDIEGIRYIQWPLGYYREGDKQCAPVVQSGPLQVFDSALGSRQQGIPADIPSLHLAWSKHYRVYPRTPDEVEHLAPWVVARLESFSGLVYSQQKREAAAAAIGIVRNSIKE